MRSSWALILGLTTAASCQLDSTVEVVRLNFDDCHAGLSQSTAQSNGHTESPPCVIRIVPTNIELRADGSGTHPDPGRTVVRDVSGRFMAANADGFGATISVWDSTGTYLTKLGRDGEGPGEFRARGGLYIYTDADGRLHVRDAATWSVFNRQLRFERKVRGANLGRRSASTVVLDNRRILTSEPVMGDRNFYFHLANIDGELIKSFGPRSEFDSNPMSYSRRARPITYAKGREFWAGPSHGSPSGYVLERWTTEGERLQVLRRDVAWFKKSEGTNSSGKIGAEPRPTIEILHVDNEGLLIVFVAIPGPQWIPVNEQTPPHSRYYNGALEVIDTGSGRLLASMVVSGDSIDKVLPNAFFQGSRMGYRYEIDSHGLPVVRMVRLVLSSAS